MSMTALVNEVAHSSGPKVLRPPTSQSGGTFGSSYGQKGVQEGEPARTGGFSLPEKVQLPERAQLPESAPLPRGAGWSLGSHSPAVPGAPGLSAGSFAVGGLSSETGTLQQRAARQQPAQSSAAPGLMPQYLQKGTVEPATGLPGSDRLPLPLNTPAHVQETALLRPAFASSAPAPGLSQLSTSFLTKAVMDTAAQAVGGAQLPERVQLPHSSVDSSGLQRAPWGGGVGPSASGSPSAYLPKMEHQSSTAAPTSPSYLAPKSITEPSPHQAGGFVALPSTGGGHLQDAGPMDARDLSIPEYGSEYELRKQRRLRKPPKNANMFISSPAAVTTEDRDASKHQGRFDMGTLYLAQLRTDKNCMIVDFASGRVLFSNALCDQLFETMVPLPQRDIVELIHEDDRLNFSVCILYLSIGKFTVMEPRALRILAAVGTIPAVVSGEQLVGSWWWVDFEPCSNQQVLGGATASSSAFPRGLSSLFG